MRRYMYNGNPNAVFIAASCGTYFSLYEIEITAAFGPFPKTRTKGLKRRFDANVKSHMKDFWNK